MAKKNEIAIDDLVKNLSQDGKVHQDVQSLYGFVGSSDSDEHIRLYLDIHLQRSISIRKEDVLYSMKVTKTHNPLGGTLLWVKNGQVYMTYGSMEKKETADKQAAEAQATRQSSYQNYGNQQVWGATALCVCKPTTQTEEENTETEKEN